MEALVKLKSIKVSKSNPDKLVLGADSVISLNNELINKPKSREDALEILKRLNNSKHYLISSVCISKNGAMLWNHTDTSELKMKNFNEDHIKTTNISGFINEKKKIIDIENYEKGHWWVQDFSSMLPIYLSPEFKGKEILDMCSAPGGKAFQALCLESAVTLNDINKKRIVILEKNLERLNLNCNITNIDALNIDENENFDVVILDSPCSGVGTLRRNPEILYKKTPPNLDLLVGMQKKLINKAAKLLKKKGVLIYMVCSFLYKETKGIKKKFLYENKNFSQNARILTNIKTGKMISKNLDFVVKI